MHRRSRFVWLIAVGFWILGIIAADWAANIGEKPEIATLRKAESHDRGSISAALREAPLIEFPGKVDCNSPGHWDEETFYLFNSAPDPWRSFGPNLLKLGAPAAAYYDTKANGGRWIEATFKDKDGMLYGWYHNEPHPVCQDRTALTAPRIGAVRSRDNGANWEDMGFVLEAPSDSLFCDTQNYYFAGGNGDFSVILDVKKEYLYFLISTYHRDVAEQGISIARMRYTDRNLPTGKVWKWHKGKWTEPGIGGHVTPIIPVAVDWNRKDADTFWGPSIHWNTHLNRYVMLLNRAIDGNWLQEGIYITFISDLNSPRGWIPPKKILDRKEIAAVPNINQGWYPQVVGIDNAKRETDKLAGRVARLFVHGKSRWEIVFLKVGEDLQ
jgi:hypothetical protein